MTPPRRTAVVSTDATNGHTGAGVVSVTLPRLPWEPEITGPDPREETRPGLRSIRNAALTERIGPMAPLKSLRLAKHFESVSARIVEREVR